MKTKSTSRIWLSLVAVYVALVIVSCQSENISRTYTNEEKARLAGQTNTQMLIAAQEALDITAGALKEKGVTEGRIAGNDWQDDFAGCKPSINVTVSIDRNRSDSLIYNGSITINYGDGAACSPEFQRTGMIVDAFVLSVSKKNKSAFKATESISFTGFGNEIAEVDGTIVVRSANGKKTSVEARNAKISFDDGTSSSWNGKLEFAFDAATQAQRRGDIRMTGSLTGFTRQGSNYTATILESMLFKAGCFGKKRPFPVSGTLQVKTDSETSTVNYGNGTCDRNYTIEVDGQTTSHAIM